MTVSCEHIRVASKRGHLGICIPGFLTCGVDMNWKAFCGAGPVSLNHTDDLSPNQRHIDHHILDHCGCLAMGFRLPLVVRSVESGSSTCTRNMATILRAQGRGRGHPAHTYSHCIYVYNGLIT